MSSVLRLLPLAAVALLSACGGGGGGGGGSTSPPATYTVGGTVSGLSGTGLVLQNSGGNNLSVSANGSFTFSTALNSGATYAVAVSTQPSGPQQSCVVANGSGSVGSANVTNVTVTCTTNTFTVGGTVSGLVTGASVVLQNNAGSNLTVSANGTFTFGTAVASGAAYAVTVLTQPTTPSQTCTVTSGSGTVATAAVSSVQVNCVANVPLFTIGGSISGLTGSGMVLQLNGLTSQSVASGATSFTFAPGLANGTNYTVAVLTQPSAQQCTVSNGSGTVAAANVTGVSIACVPTIAIGGSITGTTGSVTLNLNGVNQTFTGGGAFTFTNRIIPGNAYFAYVATQPAAQSCTIVNSLGIVVAGSTTDITNLAVSCGAKTTDALAGTYELWEGTFLVPTVVVTFWSDGTYVLATHSNDNTCGTSNGNGLEYGLYNWNATTKAFSFVSAALDTNGGCGVNDSGFTNRLTTGTIGRNATTPAWLDVDLLDNNGSGQHSIFTLRPVPSTTNTLIGSWGGVQRLGFTVYRGDNTYFQAVATRVQQNANSLVGIEHACYSPSAGTTTGTYTVNVSGPPCQVPDDGNFPVNPVDTSGVPFGLSQAASTPYVFTVTGDSFTQQLGTLAPTTQQRIIAQ